jgi:hypothetical protein
MLSAPETPATRMRRRAWLGEGAGREEEGKGVHCRMDGGPKEGMSQAPGWEGVGDVFRLGMVGG